MIIIKVYITKSTQISQVQNPPTLQVRRLRGPTLHMEAPEALTGFFLWLQLSCSVRFPHIVLTRSSILLSIYLLQGSGCGGSGADWW